VGAFRGVAGRAACHVPPVASVPTRIDDRSAVRRGTHWLGLVALTAIVALGVVTVLLVGRLGWGSWSDRGSGTAAPTDDRPPSAAPGPDRPDGVPDDAVAEVVVHIVDGDTIRIAVPEGDEDRVRLLNVDAPELAHPQRGRECGGETAATLVEKLLPPGSTVWLAPGARGRDRFERRLGYAFTADGTDVQARLVEDGLATVVVVAGDDRYAAPLRRLEGAARGAGVGVWGPGCPP
jgi:endonuclease YncB( thermonuclease family)